MQSITAPARSRALRGLRNHHTQPQWRSQTRISPRWCMAAPCRWSSSESSPASDGEKTHYITTPIFYVNAAPHIGHLYTMVLADVLKRWQVLKGKKAFLSTGTDEHGMKIQQAAAREGITPQELCDLNAQKFLSLCREAGLSEDSFIRTTQDNHKETVAKFWSELKHSLPKSLGLYKGKHSGWYSVSDECFYPESLVEVSMEPQTGKKIMASTETGSAVEWVEEETWVFPLTKYKDTLLKFYDENPGWIQPESRMKEVRNWVEHHLEDLSVTRPYTRLNWGIRDPDDSKHTIYVWVDALINYLTVAGYGKDWNVNDPKQGLWPADLQIVGKDIIRFHAVYWPALLLALGLPLPKKILCHNHWTMSNRKMSKSVGNVVNPSFAVHRWGTDPLRYFLMRNGSLSKDMDYSNDLIHAIYLKELMANLGNLLQRVARPKSRKMWSTRDAIDSYFAGDFDKSSVLQKPTEKGSLYADFVNVLGNVKARFSKEMDDNNVSGAISEIYTLLSETNRFISDRAPWQLAKQTPTPGSQIYINSIIFDCCEALRIAGILLQPIMPSKAGRILDELQVQPDRRSVAWAERGADNNYGVTEQELTGWRKVEPWDTVFPPVPGGELTDESVKAQFGHIMRDPSRLSPRKVAHFIAMEARMGAEEARKLKQVKE